MFPVSVGVFLAELFLFFDFRHLKTDDGYRVCATPNTVLNRSI